MNFDQQKIIVVFLLLLNAHPSLATEKETKSKIPYRSRIFGIAKLSTGMICLGVAAITLKKAVRLKAALRYIDNTRRFNPRRAMWAREQEAAIALPLFKNSATSIATGAAGCYLTYKGLKDLKKHNE